MKEKRYVMMIALATIVAIAAIARAHYSVYRYKGDAESLSLAIAKEIYSSITIVDMQEVGKQLIVFAKFDYKNQTYGFACFERGLNGRYRFANSVWRDIPYKASIFALNYNLNVDPALFSFAGVTSYFLVGGDNCDSIEQYGLRIANPITGEIELEKFPVESDSFLIIAPAGSFNIEDRYALLYDSEGSDITEELFTGADFEFGHGLHVRGVPLPKSSVDRAMLLILAHYALIVYLIDKFRRIKEAS